MRPRLFAGLLADVRAAAVAADRSFEDAYTMWSTATCVLEDGESAASPRVLARVGAAAMMAYHSYACRPHIAEHLPPAIRDRIEIYEREVIGRLGVPRERVCETIVTIEELVMPLLAAGSAARRADTTGGNRA